MLTIIALAAVAVTLSGCESPAAQREQAKADRILAEAQAYEQRQQADMESAAERAAIREAGREASHQRTLEVLPFVLIIVGATLGMVFMGLLFWDMRVRAQATPMDMALQLQIQQLQQSKQMQQLQLQQSEMERSFWHLIAEKQRQGLRAGNEGREVVVINPQPH